MAGKGVREIAVTGIGDPSRRRCLVDAISQQMPHSLVLDADLESGERAAAGIGNPIERLPIHGNRTAVLRAEACSACARCVRVCPSGAIRQLDGRISIDSSLCTACGECVSACRCGGVVLEEPLLAWFQVSASVHGRVVHGELAPGARVTPDLIQRLRDRARREAKLYGIETIVIDVPWQSGALFELLAKTCDERIVAVEDSFDRAASAMRALDACPSGRGDARLAVPGANGGNFRFLSTAEIQECLFVAGDPPEAMA